jgi:hypothetical protein
MGSQPPTPPLGQLLVRKGLLSPNDLFSALVEHRTTGKQIGEILVKRRLITREQLDEALAEQRGPEKLETEESSLYGLRAALNRTAQ